MPGLGRRVCAGDTPTSSIIAPSRKEIADREGEIGEYVLPFQRVAFAPPHHPVNRTMEDGTEGTGVWAAIVGERPLGLPGGWSSAAGDGEPARVRRHRPDSEASGMR